MTAETRWVSATGFEKCWCCQRQMHRDEPMRLVIRPLNQTVCEDCAGSRLGFYDKPETLPPPVAAQRTGPALPPPSNVPAAWDRLRPSALLPFFDAKQRQTGEDQ
ncbi:MAG: hypothetical protein AB7O67_23270 [Vicinamibacterales bacterium]